MPSGKWRATALCVQAMGKASERSYILRVSLQLTEEPESLQAFQRKIAFLEALSGSALLYLGTSRQVLPLYRIKTLPLCTPLFCFLIFHLSFQHNCLKICMSYQSDSNQFQMTIFFQFQAQRYYLLWHSPLKIFTLTDDIFFICYPKGSRK